MATTWSLKGTLKLVESLQKKEQFFFIGSGWDWGFNLAWLAHYIDNTPPFMSNEEVG